MHTLCALQTNHVSFIYVFIYSTANKSDNGKYKKDPHVWHWQRNKIKSYNVCHIVKVTAFLPFVVLGFLLPALYMHTYTPENSLLLVVSFSFISIYALSVATLLVLKAEIVATKWKRMKNIIKTKDQRPTNK